MKILFITSRFPYPLEKGDKLRAYNQIKELSANNEVVLYSITENELQNKWENEIENITYFFKYSYLSVWQKLLNLIRGLFNHLPFQINYFYTRKNKKEIEKLIVKFNPDVVFCQLIRMSEYVKDVSTPKVLDYMDAFSKGVQRRIQEQPFYLKKIYDIEYKRLLNYETSIYQNFDASVIISNADKDLIALQNKDKFTTIRNGVNFEYFSPQENANKDFDLVFTGNMSYPPNIAAVTYLHQEILPLIKIKFPDIKVAIAGANPAAKIKELNAPNFSVTGWVENINDYYARSRIFVAPMFIGTGLQNKLLEAMAMQLPCITSPLVNNSLGATPNEEILIANNALEYAAHITKLLEDQKFSDALAQKGNKFVRRNFSWKSTSEELTAIFEKIKS